MFGLDEIFELFLSDVLNVELDVVAFDDFELIEMVTLNQEKLKTMTVDVRAKVQKNYLSSCLLQIRSFAKAHLPKVHFEKVNAEFKRFLPILSGNGSYVDKLCALNELSEIIDSLISDSNRKEHALAVVAFFAVKLDSIEFEQKNELKRNNQLKI